VDEVGRALFAKLAAECVRRGYCRLQWWALDWNEPADRLEDPRLAFDHFGDSDLA
jgi:hypothetical protein